MVEPRNCAALADILAEVATGAASGPDRALVLSHLAECDDCRRELDELTRVADEVLLIAPQHEPPAGFEGAVLARIAALTEDAEADTGDLDAYRLDAHRTDPRRTDAPDVGARDTGARDTGARGTGARDDEMPAVVRPIRRRPVIRYLGVAAAAAVFGLGGAGIVWQTTADDRDLAANYRGTLDISNGRYFTAARLLDDAGSQVGHVTLYKGDPSWIFVVLRDAPQPGPYDVVVITDTWTGSVGTCEVQTTSCEVGTTVAVDVRDITDLQLIADDGTTLTAHRSPR